VEQVGSNEFPFFERHAEGGAFPIPRNKDTNRGQPATR